MSESLGLGDWAGLRWVYHGFPLSVLDWQGWGRGDRAGAPSLAGESAPSPDQESESEHAYPLSPAAPWRWHPGGRKAGV